MSCSKTGSVLDCSGRCILQKKKKRKKAVPFFASVPVLGLWLGLSWCHREEMGATPPRGDGCDASAGRGAPASSLSGAASVQKWVKLEGDPAGPWRGGGCFRRLLLPDTPLGGGGWLSECGGGPGLPCSLPCWARLLHPARRAREQGADQRPGPRPWLRVDPSPGSTPTRWDLDSSPRCTGLPPPSPRQNALRQFLGKGFSLVSRITSDFLGAGNKFPQIESISNEIRKKAEVCRVTYCLLLNSRPLTTGSSSCSGHLNLPESVV